MKNTKNKKSKIQNNKVKKNSIALLITIFLLVIGMFYLIEGTEFLLPEIDEATASYISFNNSNSTDMIKITNLTKMKDTVGKSILNTHRHVFEISGKKDEKYNIELYSLGNKINKKYIKYILLKNDKIIEVGNLETKEENNNGGIILYQDIIKEENTYEIKMWIDKEFNKKISNVSYEIKVNSR